MPRNVTDWSTIKTEYITDETTSYRKLAKKYGLADASVCARAKKEGWVKERERYLAKTNAKTIEAISRGQAKRASRIQRVADKLLDKIESAVDDLAMVDLFADRQALRQITAALKDIKDVQMIRSDADMREQAARIKNLERQAEEERDGATEVVITFGDKDDDDKDGGTWAG